LMTSEPDGQGQIFIDDMTKKISLAKKNFPKQELWIDGDINIERANKLQKLGVGFCFLRSKKLSSHNKFIYSELL
jgi:pentose-5-phosphate-3-epimerase